MKPGTKKLLFPVLSLVVICLVVSALIALTDSLTSDKIASAQEKAISELRQTVLPADEYAEKSDSSVAAYRDSVLLGYVFTESAKGYGGDVTVLVGIGIDGRITGVSVLSHSETAGIGALCTKEEFLSQFTGKDKTLADGEVRRTGASITSRALTNAVNSALAEFAEMTGGDAE